MIIIVLALLVVIVSVIVTCYNVSEIVKTHKRIKLLKSVNNRSDSLINIHNTIKRIGLRKGQDRIGELAILERQAQILSEANED